MNPVCFIICIQISKYHNDIFTWKVYTRYRRSRCRKNISVTTFVIHRCVILPFLIHAPRMFCSCKACSLIVMYFTFQGERLWGVGDMQCRIWSWSPMTCEEHGPRDSVDKNRGRKPRSLSLLRPKGHHFHTSWETMFKSYYSTLTDLFLPRFVHRNVNFSALKWTIYSYLHGC